MVNATAKHNQALQANLGTVPPRNSERIGWIAIMYHQVYNIQLPLDFHQGQYVYIWN